MGRRIPCSQWFVLTLLVIGMMFCGGFAWTLVPTACMVVQACGRSFGAIKMSGCKLKLTMLLLFGMLRIGEASNPGPQAQFEKDVFTLGTFNPSGLRFKENYFQAHLSYGDIWTVAETHFFGKDVARFRSGLRAQKSPHKYCVTDQSSVRRALLSQTSWKGVGVLSKHPTRAVPNGMPSYVQDSGRVLATTTLLGDAWITGAVVYGEPNGHNYPAYMKNNELLLHHAASHVCNLNVGPRFLSGDWNVMQDSLPAFAILAQAGFREIQDIALERWGYPVQMTCKGRTRPDFLYVSPEMADLLQDVEVTPDVWPDHAVLMGRFRSLRNAPSLWVWPTPEAFPWKPDFPTQATWPADVGDVSQAYASLWKQIEADGETACPFPVSVAMKGRAQRMQPKQTRNCHFAPVKIGRKGDFQPAYFGSSVKHAQWIRQTRRLQAFARLATNQSVTLGVQKAESWGAIIRAKGFFPTFQDWWFVSEFKSGDAPAVCPCHPPDEGVAFAMYESMVMAVRDFETKLRQTSRQYAKFKRDQNPNLVFTDIRPPAAPGVDILLQPTRAVVETVDVDNGQICLAQSCDFDPSLVISCAGRPLKVIHHDTDALWVEDSSFVDVGDVVMQTKVVGSHGELEHAFVTAWTDRWMRHAEVPASRWDDIVQFAQRFLPKTPMHWPAMSVLDFRQIVRTRKKSTSSGFDGVSLLDLQAMPDRAVQAFCDMYRQVETNGEWPSQLTEGKVVSLAKVSSPSSPADFRPITVFSLLYRIWSSHHSKQALSRLDQFLPDTLYGCRPGHYAAQVWAKVLWSVEYSFQHSVELTGLVADLQKAFNMIPRLVVFEIAGHLGLPGGMLVGWAGAVSNMSRRFLLRGSLTCGVPSVTGFPEGCGLSCVAMLLVDFAFHQWQKVFFPMCTVLSYVDDWQMLCPHSAMLDGALRSLEKFVQAVDLQLDQRKTYAWSLTAQGRQILREQGFAVVLAAKNLGAHVQFSRKHTNSSLMERVLAMADVWPRLRLSACRYSAKVRALLVAAWPRALHAVATTTLSDAAFHSLRAGAVKGLEADGAGCNAWLQLGMIEHPLVDPQFWAILQTIRCARDCGDPGQICSAIATLTQQPDAIPPNSVTATLLARVQTLGWHVNEEGRVFDQFGSFLLLEACMAEITLRAQWAWQLIVAQQVSHRPGFHNLQYADAGDTRAFLRSLPLDERELFHKCLNGAHITQDCKMHCQEQGTSSCPYCACTDSRYHRFWVCERFARERSHLGADVEKLLPDLPEYLTCYGWSLRPHTLHRWYSMLDAIQLHERSPLSDRGQALHFFTDGSCMNQAFPSCRLASWAIVLAHSGHGNGHVVDSGPLPGVLQSAYRAEIFAVLRTLSLARLQTLPVYIWTDCNAVVKRMHKLLQGHALKPNSAHADLWKQIECCLQDFASGQVVVTKVAAHRTIDSAFTPLEEWCFGYNSLADQAANLAQWNRSDQFWAFFDMHVNTVTASRMLSRKIQGVLVAISRAVIKDHDDDMGDQRLDIAFPPPMPEDAWKPLQELRIPMAAVRWYGDETVRVIMSWFWGVAFNSPFPVVWVSQFQLYIGFMLAGESGPTKLDRWRAGRLTPHMDLLTIPFQRRARWFSKVMKESLRHSGHCLRYCYCQPESRAFHLHTGCVAVPWDPARLAIVDEWVHMLAPAGIRRTSKCLDTFPVAKRDLRVAEVFLTSG